jgi:hypothetical protein
MDVMLESIQVKFNLNIEDLPTPEEEEFFILLKALEEPLHKSNLTHFVARIMTIKSKFFFSNNCCN